MTDRADPEFDRKMMAIALSVARRGLGNVAPNPAVGAVIVDEDTGEIVSRGWTQPGGRPHAETEAIARAGERARGKTIYVTLEPCAHQGRTPPCAEAIIRAGLARAVCGIEDPDPRVAGRGLNMLRDAGIVVERRVLAEQADWLTRGHILRVSERRPFVQLKMAMGPDGLVPKGTNGHPVWVTGPDARAHGHLLRARCDAILVGRGTVVDDDPDLTCRLPGLGCRSPLRIVLAGRDLPSHGIKMCQTAGEHPVWIFTSQQFDAGKCARLASVGCKISPVRSVAGRLWLPAVMEEIIAAGVTRLLVEGGPTVWRAFFAAGLVDSVALYKSARDNRDRETARAAAGKELAGYSGNVKLSLIDERQIGEDTLYLYRRTRGK